MEIDFTTNSFGLPWDQQDLIEVKSKIKDVVMREIGVDGVEVRERVGVYPLYDRPSERFCSCLRFTHGSASCLLVLTMFNL